jgi:hypothetical protein
VAVGTAGQRRHENQIARAAVLSSGDRLISRIGSETDEFQDDDV